MLIPSEIKVARSAAEGLLAEFATLTPAQWETPGACGVWSVAEVVAHLTWATGLYVEVIRQAQAGVEAAAVPPLPYAQRAAMIARTAQALRRELGTGLLPAFASTVQTLLALFESLTPADWQRMAPHPSGARSMRSMLTLFVVEVSVHGWEALHAAGREALLPDGCHEPIIDWLPFRLRGAFAAREPLAEPVRYLFALTSPLLRTVHLVIYGDRFVIDPEHDESGSDVVVTVHPQTYILAMMGRISWRAALDADALAVTGHTPDRDLRALVAGLSGWFPPG